MHHNPRICLRFPGYFDKKMLTIFYRITCGHAKFDRVLNIQGDQ